MRKILENYPKSSKIWNILKNDPEVNACWDIANHVAVAKLHYNDHGDVHAKIVAANALKMLQILLEHGILPDVMEEKAGDEDDAHLVVLAGALLHDIGNQVHREHHNLHGVYLAIPILNRLLPQIYGNSEKMYEIRGHILHTIYAHESDTKDLTKEAALVGIADGTDMTKGRGVWLDLGEEEILKFYPNLKPFLDEIRESDWSYAFTDIVGEAEAILDLEKLNFQLHYYPPRIERFEEEGKYIRSRLKSELLYYKLVREFV